MIQALKAYDKSFAEGMLARTSFYLNDDPLLQTFKPVDNEESIRNNIISEICQNLNIPSYSTNKQAVLDYIDNELEVSTRLDENKEKEIFSRLSARGELPTDLYTVKWQNDAIVNNFKNLRIKDENLIINTVKTPDLTYNFGVNYGASVFAKFFNEKFEYHSFFLLVVGKREGLVFTVDQVWWLNNEILAGNTFSDALELLKYFVEKFGVDVECHGKTSKLFIDMEAQNQNEFKIRMNDSTVKKSKKGEYNVVTCHFAGKEDSNNYSIFFAIDIGKYKEYIEKYSKYRLKR